MKKRFFFLEVAIGVLAFVLVMFFGVKGIAALALYAIVPFVGRAKEEKTIEDKLLFYKINSITFAIVLVFLFIVFFLQNYELPTNPSLSIRDIWLYLTITFMLFAHGVTGLIMLKCK